MEQYTPVHVLILNKVLRENKRREKKKKDLRRQKRKSTFVEEERENYLLLSKDQINVIVFDVSFPRFLPLFYLLWKTNQVKDFSNNILKI